MDIEAQRRDLMLKYRAVFLKYESPGREVLADILKECHFGYTLDPDNKVMVAEHNIGVMILHKCGVFAEGTRLDILRQLAGVMPKLPETESEE